MFGFDEQFIEKLIVGDRDCFNRFYLKTVDSFFRYAKSHYFLQDDEVYDLISDFYVKLWNNLSGFELSGNFQAYVWTMYKNLIKDYFKKNRAVSFSDLDTENYSFEDDLDGDVDVAALFEQNFQYDRIVESLSLLDDMSRDIIFFKYIESETTESIANRLDVSEDVVRQRLSRALKKLKRLLKS